MALVYNFVHVFDKGRLALSERPKIKEVSLLQVAGCNRLVTILSVSDQPQGIGKQALECGIEWDWFKVSQANNMSSQERIIFNGGVQRVYQALMTNESVLVHCSAGLHRTGMFAYALLRKDFSPEKALEIIGQIRMETREALEEKYIKFAEEFFV